MCFVEDPAIALSQVRGRSSKCCFAGEWCGCTQHGDIVAMFFSLSVAAYAATRVELWQLSKMREQIDSLVCAGQCLQCLQGPGRAEAAQAAQAAQAHFPERRRM